MSWKKVDCCGMELIWVKLTLSQQREEVSWFESTGIHVISDFFNATPSLLEQRDISPVLSGSPVHVLYLWLGCWTLGQGAPEKDA